MKKLNIWLFLMCLIVPLTFVGCENFNKNTLQTPTNLSVENGVIVFNTVSDAEYYVINLNDTEITLDPRYSSNVTLIDNQVHYNANKIFTIGESYTVKVKAIAEDKNDSSFTMPISYKHTRTISKPTNLKINNTTLTWDLVKNATFYLVKIVTPDNKEIYDINGNLLQGDDSETIKKASLTAYSFTSNTFNFSSLLTTAGNYNFYINAVNGGSNAQYIESGYTNKITYTHKIKLTTPSNSCVIKNSNQLYIHSIIDSNTNQLLVSCNGIEMPINLNGSNTNIVSINNNMATINLSNLYAEAIDFNVVKQYEFKIKAMHETGNLDTQFYTASNFSSPVVYEQTEKLESPVISVAYNTQHNCNIVEWEYYNPYVSNFNVYAISASGVKTYQLENSVTKLLLENDVFAVGVQAIGKGNYISSELSNFITINATASLPNSNLSISDNILYWDETSDSYYFLEFNNNLIVTTANTYEIDLSKITTTSSNIKLTTIKQNYLPKVENITLTYNPQLSKPIVYGFTSSNPYLLTFSEVDNAMGYYVYKSSDNVDYIQLPTIYATTAVDLKQYLLTEDKDVKYYVKVQAIADPNSIYINSEPSDYCEVKPFRILSQPQFKDDVVTKKIINDKETYFLNFYGVENANNYEILINYNKLSIDNVNGKPTYEVDISNYLTAANYYEIKIRAIPNAGSNIQPSEYNVSNYVLYKQLPQVQNIEIKNNDGVYTLSFTPVNNAENYRVRIVKVADSNYDSYLNELNLTSHFIVNQATDISQYLVQNGEYHIYITAIASANGYYGDSDESTNYGVISKLNSLAAPSNLSLENKNETTYNVSWIGDSNADYYLVRVTDPNNFKYEFNVYGSTVANISNYLTIEGEYSIQVYSMITANSENSKNYISSAATEIKQTYIYTEPHDYKRCSITMYDKKDYNNYIDNVEELKNILWYNTIYPIDHDFKLPIYINTENIETGTNEEKLRATLIEFANAASSESLNIYNFKEDSTWTTYYAPESQSKTNIQLLTYICEKLLSVYPEIHKISNLSITYSNTNMFRLYYSNSLKPETNNTHAGTAVDYNSSFNYLDPYLRRSESAIFAIDSKTGYPVTTSEQLLYAVENNYKPLFHGNSDNTELIYNNAKAVLRTIVTSNMSEVEKTTRIYDWLSYAYNVDYNAYNTKVVEDYIPTDINTYGNRKEFYLEGIFSHILNSSSTNFDGEFYLGKKIATSVSISKAFSLMCAIEGIKTLSINGEYNTLDKSGAITSSYKHNWNLVYISTTSSLVNKNWYVVDIALSDINYNLSTPASSISTINHSYFLVSSETHTNLMTSYVGIEIPSSYNLISTNDSKAKNITATQYDYYSNSTFGLTKSQIKTFASTFANGVEYAKDFEYTKSFISNDSIINYWGYKEDNYNNIKRYLLNVCFYAKYQSISSGNTNTSFEFCFKWSDIGNEESLKLLSTEINNFEVNMLNKYSVNININLNEYKDTVNQRTIVILTFNF